MINYNLKNLIKHKDVYTFLEPYEHYVIDGLFDNEILKSVTDINYLKSIKGKISTFNNDKEIKTGISHINQESGNVYHILQYLNSEEFISFLRELTDIPDLFGDPNFNGGGVHLIPKGGILDVHVDFSRAVFDESKFRRVNILLYLNEGWQESWEGALELWDNKPSEGGRSIKKLYPIFNRLAIFKTTKNSWHGHPKPLNCPENEFRKSLACYYYSSLPSDDLDIHSTIY